MKNFLCGLILFCFVVAAQAQTYSPGLPLPGLPKSLGQKTMANSTSVTLASNHSPITVTGTIAVINNSIGTPGLPMPVSATAIGIRDQSGNLQFLPIGPSGITVSASQATNPWTVFIPSGVGITNTPSVLVPNGVAITNTPNVAVPNGIGITNTPTVNQGTSPWVTSRDWVLRSTTDSVGITGTVTATPYTATTSTVSRVANLASNQTLLASNAARKGVFLYNDAATTACYVKFGATASATSFTVKMFATDTYIMDPPTYTGIIDYICDAASGSMEVNEQ